MKAVRYRVGPEGAPRIGRLESDTIVDAGASDVRGFVPSERELGSARVRRPARRSHSPT